MRHGDDPNRMASRDALLRQIEEAVGNVRLGGGRSLHQPDATGDETRAQRQQPVAADAEFDEVLDEFFRQNPRTLPPLPHGFSRADVYDDHD